MKKSFSSYIPLIIFSLYTILFFIFVFSSLKRISGFSRVVIVTYPVTLLLGGIFYAVYKENHHDHDKENAQYYKSLWQRSGHYEDTLNGPDFLEKASIQYIEGFLKRRILADIKRAKKDFITKDHAILSIYPLKIFQSEILTNWPSFEGKSVSFQAYLIEDFHCPYYSRDPRSQVVTLVCSPNYKSMSEPPDFDLYELSSREYDENYPATNAADFTLYIDDARARSNANELFKNLDIALPFVRVNVSGKLCKITLKNVRQSETVFISLTDCNISKVG